MFYNFLNSLKTFIWTIIHVPNGLAIEGISTPRLVKIFQKLFTLSSFHRFVARRSPLIGIQRWFVRFSLMLNGVNNKINARWNDVNGL